MLLSRGDGPLGGGSSCDPLSVIGIGANAELTRDCTRIIATSFFSVVSKGEMILARRTRLRRLLRIAGNPESAWRVLTCRRS